MTDVWWGVVEAAGPRQYNWTAYVQLVELCENVGLTVQFVTSFHSCGGNNGDTCDIPLPAWVLAVGAKLPGVFYQDAQGHVDTEYLSLGVDTQPVFAGRTALQMYDDYFSSMAATFAPYAPHVLEQVQVGMGPAGELRYPSYQLAYWSYCGVGEFQCYDQNMLEMLASAASFAGHPEWGTAGPANARNYNAHPGQVGFFTSGASDNYASDYGRFFLGWYSGVLLNHSEAILQSAQSRFASLNVGIAAKISGVHWWYDDNSHAAEVTAGYYNTNGNNAYWQIARSLLPFEACFDFTALEMTESAGNGCGSDPQSLVAQAMTAARSVGVPFCGENALPICDSGGCDSTKLARVLQIAQTQTFQQFTYLRLTDGLLRQPAWGQFTSFINQMASL